MGLLRATVASPETRTILWTQTPLVLPDYYSGVCCYVPLVYMGH